MKESYSFLISLGALIVSVFSLGWNFYRDVILKPRMRVRISISNIVSSEKLEGTFVSIEGVNHGPGAIICNGIVGRFKPWWKFSKEKKNYFIVIEDYTNPYSDRFPKRLEVGDSVRLLFPYKKENFLLENPWKVGIRDAFSRVHWASGKSLKEAKKDFFKDFKKQKKKEAL